MYTAPSVIVLLSCAALSVASTLLTLYIIRVINRWNGYIQLVFNLSLAQLVYDASMVFIPLRQYNSFIEWTYIAIRCVAGLVATSFTNILASVVVYAVWKRSTFDIDKTLRYAKPIILVVSIVFGSMVSISLALDSGSDYWSYAYGFLRALSITINIVLYLVLTTTLYLRNRNAPKRTNDPLEVLVNRFKYYPLVQVISRAAVIIHEYKYGFEYTHPDGSVTWPEKISLYLYVTTLPSLGVLYFLVFLSVSPGAFETLKLSVRRAFSLLCCCISPGRTDLLLADHKSDQERGQDKNDRNIRRSSDCSEKSAGLSDVGSSYLDDVLLFALDRGSGGGGDGSRSGSGRRKYLASTGSGLDFNELSRHPVTDRSSYLDLDEEDLILEIEKLYQANE